MLNFYLCYRQHFLSIYNSGFISIQNTYTEILIKNNKKKTSFSKIFHVLNFNFISFTENCFNSFFFGENIILLLLFLLFLKIKFPFSREIVDLFHFLDDFSCMNQKVLNIKYTFPSKRFNL